MGNLHNYKRRGREYLVNSKRGVYNESRRKIVKSISIADIRKVYENREVLLKMEEGKKCQN